MTTEELDNEIAKLYYVASNKKPGAIWVEAIEGASDEAVLGVISLLSTAYSTNTQTEGLRESARASFDARLARRALEVEERLEAAATRLGTIGIVASVVIGIATIAISLLSARGAS